MNDLLFSICVPVYNVEKYLHECIDSVLNQSYGLFELILVDDGSTDNSYQICKDYQSKDVRIKAFTKENGGQISAREFAFGHVSGDVVMCVDSDDFIESNTLEILNDYFKNDDPDCIYFNWQRVCDGKIVDAKKIITNKDCLIDIKDVVKKLCFDAYYNSMCIKAFKKSLLPKRSLKDFYNVRHGEDLVQTLEIFENAKSVLFVPDVLYNYRVNLNSISYKRTVNPYFFKNTVRSYVYHYLKKKNFFSAKDWDDYGKYCAELLWGQIYEIAAAKISLSRKKECLKIIRSSEYYVDYLFRLRTSNFVKNQIIWLFEKKIDVLVFFVCKMISLVKKRKN